MWLMQMCYVDSDRPECGAYRAAVVMWPLAWYGPGPESEPFSLYGWLFNESRRMAGLVLLEDD